MWCPLVQFARGPCPVGLRAGPVSARPTVADPLSGFRVRMRMIENMWTECSKKESRIMHHG